MGGNESPSGSLVFDALFASRPKRSSLALTGKHLPERSRLGSELHVLCDLFSRLIGRTRRELDLVGFEYEIPLVALDDGEGSVRGDDARFGVAHSISPLCCNFRKRGPVRKPLRRNLMAANHAAEPRVKGNVLASGEVFSDCSQSSIAIVRIKVRV